MMEGQQLSNRVLQNARDISAIRESTKSAHKRIDENDRITDGIHKLASNVEALALQVKMLTESLENSVSRLEAGQKAQGERIGALEREPATKWKDLVKQVIGLIVAAVAGVIIAKFI